MQGADAAWALIDLAILIAEMSEMVEVILPGSGSEEAYSCYSGETCSGLACSDYAPGWADTPSKAVDQAKSARSSKEF